MPGGKLPLTPSNVMFDVCLNKGQIWCNIALVRKSMYTFFLGKLNFSRYVFCSKSIKIPYHVISRDLSIIRFFLFTIPRIFNTKNDTIQYQKTIPPKNNFFILLHFLPFQTILSIFWKSPFLGPKKAHIMGIWAENHPFGVFSYKCLELSNSSRNGIKIQSWIVLNSIEYYRVLKI